MVNTLHKEILVDLGNIIKPILKQYGYICHAIINDLFHSIEISSNDGFTSIYIKYFNNKIIISNIMFKNKHEWCGTALFERLIKFCDGNDIDGILVISILTPEMKGLCEKFDFKITDGTKDFLCENYYGDYYLPIGK